MLSKPKLKFSQAHRRLMHLEANMLNEYQTVVESRSSLCPEPAHVCNDRNCKPQNSKR